MVGLPDQYGLLQPPQETGLLGINERLSGLATNPLFNIGIGMLGSRSPHFGNALAAGGQQLQQGVMLGEKMKDNSANRNYREQMLELAKQRATGMGNTPSELQVFNSMTQGMSPDEVAKARRTYLGLSPRASGADNQIVQIGDVPYRYNRQTDRMEKVSVGGDAVTPETVGDNRRIIGEKQRFGEGVGKFSADTLSSAYQSYGKASEALYNMTSAIDAIDRGAGIGVIQNMLPSIRSASIELDNIRQKMGLDVIGSVTFGALSKGELDIALSTAMPEFKNPASARDWLVRKSDAQRKLMNYYQEQMNYIANGGSVVDFLNEKGNARGNGANPAPSNSIPKVTNDAEYNALPPGTTFIAPDGTTRKKQ